MRTIQVIIVAPGASSVTCPECGKSIPISRRKQDNPIYCTDIECNYPLVIQTEDGESLNTPWAAFRTDLEHQIGDLFGMARFDKEATANRWRNFEEAHPDQEGRIFGMAQAIHEKASGLRGAAWGVIASAVENRTTGQRSTSHQIVEEPAPEPRMIHV